MKYLLFWTLLPMLLVGCEPSEPIEDPACGKHPHLPALWHLSTAYNGDSYRAPSMSAGVIYEHPIGTEETWEKLSLEFWSSQEVFPIASGYDGTFLYYKSPYPEDHIPIVITNDDNAHELDKRFATSAQLLHLGSQLLQLPNDREPGRYTHAEVVDMTITADVPLFGREAGSNLMDKFGIKCIYELVDFATYDVLDTAPKVQTVESIKNTLLQELYQIRPVVIPEERYDKVTFTITIDIRRPDGKLVALTNSVAAEFEN